MKDIFWYEDVSVLYKNDNYLDFIPNSKMNYNEKINAIVRFCIYAIILSFVFNKSQRILILPILIIIMTKIFNNKNIHSENFKESIKNIEKDEIIENQDMNLNIDQNSDQNNDIDEIYNSMIQIKNQTNETNEKNETNKTNKKMSFESGTLNKDGTYEGGEIYRDPTYPTLDKINMKSILEERKPIITRQPTTDNPYMNPFVTDFNNDDIIPAPSNADDIDIQNKISKKFNNGLFMNIDDMWNIKNSQRQFFTLPVSSIAGGQKEFSEWLYKNKECCKTDQLGCLRYEDLRYKRF